MTDYVKGRNFTADRGADADPAVFDVEFSSVANAMATKMDKSGGTFVGQVVIPADSRTASSASGTPSSSQVVPDNHIYMHAFPTGTVMSFFQASAPAGWTQVVTQNDAMLRVVSAAGGGRGGSDSPIAGPTVTSGHALTVSEMPAHTHTGLKITTSIGDAGKPIASPSGGGTTGSTGGNAAHRHNIPAWQPKYIDMILARKD